MDIHDLTVDPTQSPSDRLDRWITDQLGDLSRSQVQRLIEQGQVQINQQVCQSKKIHLAPGDRVTVRVPDPEPLPLDPEAIPLDVLYEDDQLILLNKPAGMVVHPAPGHSRGTLVHALLAHCQIQTPQGIRTTLSGIGGTQRPGIVHRLDKDTSGAIVVAKSDRAHQHLQAQIAAKTARREYLGLVYGNPSADSGTLDHPLGRHPVHREKQAVVPVEQGGRPALTHWQVQERLGNYALIHFRLETGRTHQIRVHCAAMGHPILGDPLYSRGRSLKMNLTGQALHAWKLSLRHPLTEALITVEAPPPLEFQRLLEKLAKKKGS
ncbi:RluA family pseudouridine synthase [Lyngbya confervoides]|uniref:Pseudouridine synthase n=1 Tax=Lyngbya confervoides BDU141951 TaxID=1574623 RepID=A0ABD4T253_9CYAN|nr:RluA family pseudouridine synthase [Lyngbya confervoides]MCM1982817.1 RluA family pseudouridine synthase [Lyngbya confervoides BDU141951]